MARISAVQKIVLGFLLVIALGTLLLALPVSGAGGQPLSVFDACFTSTSAVCVTGLSVIDCSARLSFFGQVVLLCLIQIGGLGFMTVAVLFFTMLRRRVSISERLVLQQALNADGLQGLIRLTRHVLLMTFIIELGGACLLAIRFIPVYGPKRGLFYSLFHAVSAFCNAGFDIIGARSLMDFSGDWLICLTIMALIVLGGIGFIVIQDILQSMRQRKRLALHTTVVLITSACLTVLGAVLIGIAEWNNPATLGSLACPERMLGCVFQSVTTRTAGFSTIDQAALTPASQLLSSLLMFIGASPASTGGGLKTTTLVALIVMVRSVIRNQRDVHLMHRRLAEGLGARALAIFSTMIAWTMAVTLLLCLICPAGSITLGRVIYESISALCTVGLSCGVTAMVPPVGKAVLIITMFIGRVGMLTFMLALATPKNQPASIRLPEDRILIG
nr:TrkH family potassium uptake protein [bacterium]